MAKPFGQKEKQLGKGESKMNKIKLLMIFLVVVAIFATVVVHATSDKQVEPKQVTPKAGSEIKTVAQTVPQTKPLSGSRQGYKMVAYVIDGFGGKSESDNYKIPVNAGGQALAIGISQSDNYVVKAGFVHASHVNRGDANGDGVIELGDIVYLINFVYKGGDPPCPMETGDANCDGIVELGDIVYLINYVYRSGPPPAC
jgi:hypothetical protein